MFIDLPEDLPHKRVVELITKIKNQLVRARKFGDKETVAQVELWEQKLQEMRDIANKTGPPPTDSKLPAPLRKALKEMAKPLIDLNNPVGGA